MDASYISRSPGVNFDEGVKQVLSVVLPNQSETQTSTSKFEGSVCGESCPYLPFTKLVKCV